MKSITPQELAALGEHVALIDIREPDEVARVRVPYATNLPMSELIARVDEIPDGAYIMCHSGGRSGRAVEYLTGKGHDVIDVDGGISAWEHAGLPVERG